MKFRKITALLLALVSVGLLFTGCKPKRPTGENGELIVWVGEGSEDYFRKIADKFEKDTGVYVELVTYTGLNATDKLALDGPAGNGGDVYVQGGGAALAKGVDQGLFMELPEDQFNMDAFVDGAADDYRYNGKLYGLPMGAETPAIIYNKDLLPEIPETWEELMDVCGEYANLKEDRYGFLMDPTNPYFTNALFAANGGYVFGQDENGVYDVTDIGLNTKGVKDTYRTFMTYYQKRWWLANTQFSSMEKKFEEGKSCAIYDGPWAVQAYVDAGINVGIAPLPPLANGNVPMTYSGSYGLAISEYAQNPEAAVEFLKYCTTEEAIMDYSRLTSRLPVLKACLEEEEIVNDPILSGFAEQLKNSVPQPNIPEMDQIWAPMLNAGSLIFSQHKDIDETLDQAVARIREQIELMKQ